ncbi:hypothetical protein F5B22DRAFT_641314 [Xylaria bambusicola]|uniref:uncharacterized protein n=1 Tax=Xylaria bambusicola TaxID=326684 RepID=UPI0020072A41|nr:uncharacterized protein F5B22DRAFT_641314 [Xylaria bambusicola]KAI0526168.1 hypothetical protein F5B22DRAFT_641314 [Xylaria bambusicola]
MNFEDDIFANQQHIMSECTVPGPAESSALGKGCGNCEKLLLQILLKLEYVERELARNRTLENRFDKLDSELAKNNRLETIERDLKRVGDSTVSLATDLRTFSVDVTSRLKEIDVY